MMRMDKSGAEQASECTSALDDASADPHSLDAGSMNIAIGRSYFTPLFCSHRVC